LRPETDEVESPQTRHAKSGDVHIAYQVVGEGELGLALVAEFWHSIEAQWEEPALAAFLRRLGSFGRLLLRSAGNAWSTAATWPSTSRARGI
jgi:hypothetical protein